MDLIEQIKEEEGYRETVYDDATGKPIRKGSVVVGNPTIGFGRNLADRGINSAEAYEMLRRDLSETFEVLLKNFSWFARLSDARQCVLMSMCFNMGIGRLRGFRKMLAAIDRSDWSAAAYELLDSKAARDLPGRYRVLAKMMRYDLKYEAAKKGHP
jgi:lysozyme